MKAYGFQIGGAEPFLEGACVREDGSLLGYWTSTNTSFLEHDLKNHAGDMDYEFLKEVPEYLLERCVEKGWME